jgi:hypothetical protein
MANEKNSVIVELYDLTLTEKKDDRFGRVVTTKSLKEDDLINLAVQRRTDLNPSTLRSSLDILKEIATEELANGASVYFGLGYFNLLVNGVFIGDHAKWNPEVNSLHVRAIPSVELRDVVKGIHVDVRGMAQSGLVINTVVDVASGEEGTRLTPGGGVNLTGARIRVAGDSPEIGIRLTNQIGGEVTVIPATSILVNEPSKVSFIVPADLLLGEYQLSLTTQYSHSAGFLKEPRTYVYPYLLSV